MDNDNKILEDAKANITDQFNDIGSVAWLEGWICGFTDTEHVDTSDMYDALFEHLHTLKGDKPPSDKPSIDLKTVANVINCIQRMKENEVSTFITNSWIKVFINDIYECGLVAEDEHVILTGVFS